MMSLFFLSQGYIIQKCEKKPSLVPDKPAEELLTYEHLKNLVNIVL